MAQPGPMRVLPWLLAGKEPCSCKAEPRNGEIQILKPLDPALPEADVFTDLLITFFFCWSQFELPFCPLKPRRVLPGTEEILTKDFNSYSRVN